MFISRIRTHGFAIIQTAELDATNLNKFIGGAQKV